MQSGEWNLQIIGSSIKVYFIYPLEDIEDDDEIQIRMFLLSHQISFNGIPSIFLEKLPPDPLFSNSEIRKTPIIACFDIDGKMAELCIPEWTNLIETEWTMPAMYRQCLVDIFQRALTLYFLYKLFEFSPIYFTSFLYFEDDPVYNVSGFFVKYCPVLHNNEIGIRTVVHNDPTVICNNPRALPKAKFVLVSPYEHTFSVRGVSGDTLTLQKMDSVIQHVPISSSKFVILTEFSKNFIKGSDTIKQKPIQTTVKCSFEPLKTFTYKEEEWTDFFHKYFFLSDEDTQTESKNEGESVIEDAPSTSYDYLTEQCETCILHSDAHDENPELRKKAVKRQLETIFSVVGSEVVFPPSYQPIIMKNINSLSPIDFNFGFPSARIEKHISDFTGQISEFNYEPLQIPKLSVVQEESVTQIDANSIFDGWVENRRAPLSGQKNLHYRIFGEDSISQTQAIDYTRMIAESYTKHRLGTFVPKVPDQIKTCTKESLEQNVLAFVKENKGDEFHSEKDVLVIITDNNFEDKIDRIRCYSLFIRPKWIINPKTAQIDALAFQMYTKIRVFLPAPFGSFELTEQKKGIFECIDTSSVTPATTLFFGVRLTPPYTLPVYDELSIHIAILNHEQRMIAVFTDSTAQALQPVLINDFNGIRSYISGTANLTGKSISETTVTVYADSITNEFYQRLKAGLSGLPVTILSLFPLTILQVRSLPDTDFIVDASEVPFDNGTAIPSFRCIVGSSTLQSYTLAIYDGSQEKLHAVAREFSQMSWVSVKPGMENRTTSFPPHITGLLRVGSTNIKTLSPFDFLPPSFLDF